MNRELAEIGARVRARMGPGLSQRELAGLVEMTPDALSRALNGQRGFASVELVKVADVLGVDVHWLITGRDDPLRVDVAARHSWDSLRAQPVNPGRDADDLVLERVVSAYRSAFPDGAPPSALSSREPKDIRTALEEGFVRAFAERVELRLGVDIVRVAGLTTDYSVRFGDRGLILLAATPNWFRSNWSLAHELGHLALDHHAGSGLAASNERPANAFAAELLLPEDVMRSEDWLRMSQARLAQFVWVAGVSTEAVRHRLRTLQITVSDELAVALEQKTQRLLRQHFPATTAVSPGDSLTVREQEASTRRFPVALLTALADRVRSGTADPEPLAWALDVPIDEIDYPDPSDDPVPGYAETIAQRPSARDWEHRPDVRTATST